MKKRIALALLLVMTFMCTFSYAATGYNGTSYSAGSNLYAFKFEHKNKGIGCGTCPVYTAPYMSAYRINGNAACDTNHSLDVGGFDSNGWLLVRYQTNNGSTRVGWIPPSYVRGVKTSMYPHFGYVAQRAGSVTPVTDNNLNPYDSSSYFAQLGAGETYYLLGYYDYYGISLSYIEFTLYGQTARGFILN